MHVVGNRPHVIKELGVNRPAIVLAEYRTTTNRLPSSATASLSKNFLPSRDRNSSLRAKLDLRSLPRSWKRTISRRYHPIGSERVQISRVQFDSTPRMQKASWHPSRSQSQQPSPASKARSKSFATLSLVTKPLSNPGTRHEAILGLMGGGMLTFQAKNGRGKLSGSVDCFAPSQLASKSKALL